MLGRRRAEVRVEKLISLIAQEKMEVLDVSGIEGVD